LKGRGEDIPVTVIYDVFAVDKKKVKNSLLSLKLLFPIAIKQKLVKRRY